MKFSKYLVLPAMTMIMGFPAHAAAKVEGTLKSLKADSIVITAADGKDQTFGLAKDVMFMPSKDQIKAGVKAGIKVTIYLAADGKTAVHVMTGTM